MRGLLRLLAVSLMASLVVSGTGPLAHAGEADPDRTPEGRRCEPVRVSAAGPVTTGGCTGVRPGATVRSSRGTCTLNFVFRGSDGARYIGTAGHCIIGGGERRWAVRRGPLARNGSGRVFGRFVYAVVSSPKDFALVRIPRGVRVSAQTCGFGGPTGINRERRSGVVQLRHYGKGMGVSWATPGRTLVAYGMPSPHYVHANGAVAPGDSGSGAMTTDGRAVGVVVTAGVHTGPLLHSGTVGITRLGPQVSRAARVLGIGLRIVTAPRR